ncbi:MAG TPA: DUF3501 family protein [Nitrospiraceae bacterium]|nr:DUF3501 family protein [Nitrospiraceae bacterium]
MIPLTKTDLLSYEDYERSRDAFRKRIIDLKQRRRLSVGDKITLLFENRETIQFQIQEMIRAERIVDPDKVQVELDVYNALLPGEGELSATLFIEITDSDHIERDLDAFQGIDRGQTVALRAGSLAIYGHFEGGHSKEDKISAVHFVKFCPSSEWIQSLAQKGTSASVQVNHSAYRREAQVPEEMKQEWLADLRA